MMYARVLWTRQCAGCLTTIKAMSYAAEDDRVKGLVFHNAVCIAVYWALKFRQTKPPGTLASTPADRSSGKSLTS